MVSGFVSEKPNAVHNAKDHLTAAVVGVQILRGLSHFEMTLTSNLEAVGINGRLRHTITLEEIEYRLCFAETEGSSQCQGSRHSCTNWSRTPSWTNSFRDDTDGRGGGCRYAWKIESRTTTITKKPVCWVCFKETEGSSQCQGSHQSCSGWSANKVPAWTLPFRDDTDNRGGGCTYSWYLDCTPKCDAAFQWKKLHNFRTASMWPLFLEWWTFNN